MIRSQSNNDLLESIKHNIDVIKQNVAEAAEQSSRSTEDIKIMAVTKTVPFEQVNIAISQGISLLGENRVQELISKYDFYNVKQDNIHFIGHLQTNKIKYIIDKVCMVESVDSIKLAEELNKQAKKHNKMLDVLIEVNIGQELSKSGVGPEDLEEFLKNLSTFESLSIQGLMTIPPVEKNDYFFSKMHQLFVDIKDKNVDNVNMSVLSMGMSADYEKAIKHGSNIVRIGTAMFGTRK
ncbi:MAG: YggS family pyridoxal phosphate-dependent enzyme [Oscillospiraceae bacterium]|jgi:pyridoxal phosphate enzyme (YggS family)|nr:YggS family pyridoxal phosphate-dependent enzyme [Oscillospiraceae bacterium]